MSKNYRKFVAGTVTAAVVASAIAPAASAATFSDVDPASSHAEAIDALSEAGVINGYPDGTFKPGNSITRGQVAKMIARTIEGDGEVEQVFDDVPVTADEELVKAAQEVFEAGAITGANGKLMPANEITRQQMAKVLVEAFGLTHVEGAESQVTDLDKAYPDFREYIEVLSENGVTNVEEFRPLEKVSRAQFASFVYRALAVNEIVEVAELEDIKVMEGEEVELPETVEVTYANDTTAEVAVEWDEVDTSKVGTQTVEGTIEGTDLKASVKVIVEAAAPAVKSAEFANAKELVVTFNKAVEEDTVEGNVTVKSLDSKNEAFTSTLSEDGKTLTLTATNANIFEGRYDITVDGVETTEGKEVAKYEATIKAEDKVAPAITGVERITASELKINFSEPVQNAGVGSYKYADGEAIQGLTPAVSADNKSVVVTLGADVEAEKEIEATFVGVKDFAGNLISPNPTKVTFEKGDKDGTEPEVEAVKVINASKFEISFSEELTAAPAVTVGDAELTVEQDEEDKTKYIVQLDAPVSGLQTVAVAAGYTDKSGEVGEAFSKVVNFAVDTVDPELKSVKAVTVEGVEYLEVTFNEDVKKNAALAELEVSGKSVKDYVTSNVSTTVAANEVVAVEDNDKAFRIALADIVGSGEAVEGAKYELTFTAKNVSDAKVPFVKDLSGNEGVDAFEATFTRGEDEAPASTQKAELVEDNEVVVVDTNTLTVNFTGAVDGVTATDVDNYEVSGAVVEKAVLNPVVDGKQSVTLTLKADSNTFTGERNIAISGVKAKDGLAMDEYTSTIDLDENVRPTVTEAKLTAPNQVTVKFSEAVVNGDAKDFDLYVDGEKSTKGFALAEVDVATKTLVFQLTDSNVITPEELEDGLEIKAVDTLDIADAAGNKVNVEAVEVK